MTLILVEHDTAIPARYAAAAAAVSLQRGCEMMYLPSAFDTGRHADAVQHVVSGGGLGPSGLCWFERLNGRPAPAVASADEIIAAAATADIAVPVHAAFLAEPKSVADLARGAVAAAVEVERMTVVLAGSTLVEQPTGAPLAWIDRFGRFLAEPPRDERPDRALLIGLIGAESDHREVYPAALASLADAAQSLSVDLSLRFIDPSALQASDIDGLATLSGILLPGGSAMKNVRGQIEVANACLRLGLPTAGLCLGMQSMATAIAWQAFGRGRANLAEADPDAEIKTFIAMSGRAGAHGSPLPEHRTGDQVSTVNAGTRFSALLPENRTERYNHRFQLDPSLLQALQRAGLVVGAEGLDGAIVDAIEHGDHPFFMGMQGHPEQNSSPQQPHPLLVAFLQAALAHDIRRA